MPATEKRGFFRSNQRSVEIARESGPVFPQARERRKQRNSPTALQPRAIFYVGDETRAFDAKEIFRRFLVPVPIARRSLQRIKRSVDLNGIECAGGEFQFAPMWPSFWIKDATPAGIIPTGNANANLAFHTRFNRKSGATSILFRRQRR